MHENNLYKMERRHSECLFTDGKKHRSIVLSKLQAEKLAEELPDMLCMIGRGKVHYTQGRRHL